MNKKAVIENISGENAILLVGEKEEEVVVSIKALPEGAVVGDWTNVKIKDGEVVEMSVDKEETKAVKERILRKMEELRKRMGK